jgi:hypothetical protein
MTNDTEISLAALTPDPRNARRHGERNRQLIVDTLKDVGAARSIGVDERGVVVAGNATISAACASSRPTAASASPTRSQEPDRHECHATRCDSIGLECPPAAGD